MDKTGPTAQPIKYDPQFISEVDKYIADAKGRKKAPTVKGFARFIGTDEESVIAWANKKKKDEAGNLTEELARPEFLEQISKLKQSSEIKPIEVKEKVEKVEKSESSLNAKQELFCQLYASDKEFFGNGVATYAEAYNLDLSKPKDYNTAKSNAWRLLTNADILERIDEILELGPLNDTFVDKQLAKVIAQDADFSSKVSAIREYNKLKQRITEKIDHSTLGKEMPTPIYGGKSTTSL